MLLVVVKRRSASYRERTTTRGAPPLLPPQAPLGSLEGDVDWAASAKWAPPAALVVGMLSALLGLGGGELMGRVTDCGVT